MAQQTTTQPFRLAFRPEGEFVYCYFAAPDTIAGAMLLSSMRRSVLEKTPSTFAKWRELMQEVLAAACVGALGVEPVSFEMQRAPEHERSGRA